MVDLQPYATVGLGAMAGRAYVAARRRRRRAQRRAADLLRGHLDETQQLMLSEHGFFYVRARDGHVFALVNGWKFYGVDRRTGRPHTMYRAGTCPWDCPRGDRLLAQVLALRASPEVLVGVACQWAPMTSRPLLGDGGLYRLHGAA